jgi:hypothetical protein
VEANDLRLTIQRRRYADHLRRRLPIPGDLAALFQTCPKCAGRGEVGWAVVEPDGVLEVDDICPRCGGERFVDREA